MTGSAPDAAPVAAAALDPAAVLGRFSAPTREWFTQSFAEPTAAQLGAWDAVARDEHALVVAPTGSGKTLSAFLWALDGLVTSPVPEDPLHRCRVLYVSPLKALASDVERNLRAPLTGIRHAALRLGHPEPQVRVAMRSGDTPAAERRAIARTPPDVLITTPESLFLLLTSQARQALAGVRTVIVDEVHAVAGTKRGAHLALSLERLDALLDRPAQRIGLSATVRPVDEVARFLAGSRAPADGGRRTAVVQPPSTKVFDLRVVVPVADMGELGQETDDLTGPAAGAPRTASIWPHVEERVVDLVTQGPDGGVEAAGGGAAGTAHRSTLVFANSRRLAERLTARLNEVWAQRQEDAEALPDPGSVAPAQVMAQAGASVGAPAVLARAHHGSVSKEQRALIEDDLKSGRLPAVVATSSLELGIDMGAIDLVVQVESPPSVASGLQRIGRAGHQVGAVSRGVLFPKFRGDLVQTAVVTERMRAGRIEALRVPSNPLDVLAQQVVAMTSMDDWPVDDLETVVRRAAPFATLTRGVLESVLDMLAGRYPSEEFAELRPRLVWDRVAGVLSARPGAQRLAVTSGGTIPDRGLYGVFLATGEGPGRRVGELDEEMVYESRVGDVFTLGASSWRIEDITHDQVLVTPAPGQPGRLPFWHGDSLGRPAELGAAIGGFVRELAAGPGGLDGDVARHRVAEAGLDTWATDNLLAYLREQQDATGHVPDDRTLVVERFRDELGDWRVVVHSPFGAQVHAPWALAVAARMREKHGVDVQAMPADDGLVLRLPDLELEGGEPPDVTDALLLEPEDVEELVTAELGGSALFSARFRECAARALLLPRRRPDRRQPLWQQRQRAAQLLEVASRYPSFPVVLETVREVLQDVFDVPGLVSLLRDLRARQVRVVDVTTQQPSPFARSLLFGYVAQFLYEGDSPLAERRAAALALDPSLLAELLGRGEGAALADLLDPQAVLRTHGELQRLAEDRRARDAEDVADLLRVLGPLSTGEVAQRSLSDEPAVAGWLASLEQSRRVIAVRVAGEPRWAAVEDAGRLRDALGTPLPVGVAETFTEPVPDPVGDLVTRYARTHVPFTAPQVAHRYGLGVAVVTDALRRLEATGRVASGELLPDAVRGVLPGVEPSAPGALDYCDAEVLRVLRRRSLAALRAEVEPVPAQDLATFLPAWQGVSTSGSADGGNGGGRSGGQGGRRGGLRGVDGLVRVVEQLAGAVLPASGLETLVLPARVRDYSPALLDELTASGEVLWAGHGALPGDDGWVSLHLADTASLTLPEPETALEPTDAHRAVLDALAGGGAYFFRALSDAVGSTDDAALTETLWDLVWAGHLTNDTLAPLRARLTGGRVTHRRAPSAPRTRYARPGRGGLRGLAGGAAGRQAGRAVVPSRSGPPSAAGRWSLLPPPEQDATLRAHATAEVLLDRYGVLTRGSVGAERVVGGFAAVYRVLAAMEEAGRVRRGYFVEGLGASQFASTGAVDRLRASARPVGGRPGSRAAADEGPWAGPPAPDGRGGGPRRPDPGRSAGPGPDVWWEQPSPRPDGGARSAVVPPAVVLAAADPANPYGAALPWPERPAAGDGTVGHRPGRKAGAVVVLVDGDLVLYVERGGRSLLSWTDDPTVLRGAADGLAGAVRDGALGRLTVQRADGEGVLTGGPLAEALEAAGFHATPRGLRMRPGTGPGRARG
ncbi:ATP-dependent helicase [Thalassiella azotivora]